MKIKKTVTTIIKEEITITIDNKVVSVDKEKEIETLEALAEASKKVLNLNSEK